ncbi:MAG: AraC family ligand binding domain-containing protein [Clostridia bacterium]
MRDTPLTIMSMMGEEVIPITVTTNLHHGKGLMHSHTFFEFVYIDHGFALHTCNKVTSIVSEGDWFLIRPNEPHNYISAYIRCCTTVCLRRKLQEHGYVPISSRNEGSVA